MNSPFLKHFRKKIVDEPALFIEGLWDSAKALLLAEASKALSRHIVIITGGESESRLLDDLEHFSHHKPIEFPAWEVLPGEEIPPSIDIVGRRLSILHKLLTEKTPLILVTPLQGVLQKLVAPQSLKPLCHKWKVGIEIPFATIANTLTHLGYTRVPVVASKGEFAMRGGIVDLYPVCSKTPYRLDFFGDEVEAIRPFDPIAQISTGKVNELTLTPANEYDLLLTEPTPATLLDYLGENPLIVLDDLVALEDKAISLKDLPGAKTETFQTLPSFLKSAASLRKLYLSPVPIDTLSDGDVEICGEKLKGDLFPHPFEKPFTDLANLPQNLSLEFLTSSDAEQKALHAKLEGLDLPETTTFNRGYISSGYYLADSNHNCIAYADLTGRHKVHREKAHQSYHTPAAEFHELTPGDYVVHTGSGVGKFLGIETQTNHEGEPTEFILIEYAKGGKLFVPVSQSHLVSRYIGATESAPELHTIGSANWNRAKTKAQQAIIGYAHDLLTREAERELQGGFACPDDTDDMLLFEEEFPFCETPDQLNAIASIKDDMKNNRPMDRLICGDVGYGKTEVAMRAAFKAVCDGEKQVAILVPTTTLAMQHYETFKDRMSSFPLNIKLLSRFVPKKEQTETLKGLKDGTVDIVIGTHRLTSQDISFKNLGLTIIDEEQRFGVRAKEHLKKFKTGVDYLTLSATPIPRTLYMSLVGAREISLINTPPQDRLPIKTIIAEREEALIKNAILRELARDGQIYFIHNRVESIGKVTEMLQTLVPQARIVTGHGQMTADQLDQIIHTFKSGKADILVATTIVENGIDIPNANTILIDRADTFGMGDLYQLRGRVGRWNRPAYCYFLTPKNRELSEISRKRLGALVETSGFGGGMKLAMRDLEIRGAGDLLGLKQSGHVSSIGFHLYCKLLKQTVNALKQKKPATFLETKVEFPFEANFPSSYIPETSLRLELYHRLGTADSEGAVEIIRHELIDRFGPLPNTADLLLHITRIRIAATARSYTLLKYHNQTLITHRQTKKEVQKQNRILPFFKTPAQFEDAVLSLI